MPLSNNICCCHNDLVAANIIATPELRFLDWEYACDNDPLFDFATVVAHHNLSSARMDYLLNAYFNGDGQRWREHLARQTKLYEALLWLWEAARS
jgi:thiamine kinase-like enzyme